MTSCVDGTRSGTVYDMKQNVRTARGTIHTLTIGREYRLHGYPCVNREGAETGKADCGSLTSGAAEVTTDAVTCPKCM